MGMTSGSLQKNTAKMLLQCFFMAAAIFGSLFLFLGCRMSGLSEEKLSDLEFTVVPADDVQEDIRKLIGEKKEGPFQMSYSDGNYKYIVVGYGKKDTGGYSIQVDEVYDTENTICVKTTLLGPESDDAQVQVPSYPYIVIKIENLDKTVVFPDE